MKNGIGHTGHSGAHKVTFLFKKTTFSKIFCFKILYAKYEDANFYAMQYDIKDQFYVKERFCDLYPL